MTGKVTGAFATGDAITLLVNNKTYTGTANADGSFSINVSTADLVADADTKIEGQVSGTGGDTATAAQDYTVDNSNLPTRTALTLDPITADNVITDTENVGSINVTGTVTGKFASGDRVTLTVNGKTYSGLADAAGKFTIPVLS